MRFKFFNEADKRQWENEVDKYKRSGIEIHTRKMRIRMGFFSTIPPRARGIWKYIYIGRQIRTGEIQVRFFRFAIAFQF